MASKPKKPTPRAQAEPCRGDAHDFTLSPDASRYFRQRTEVCRRCPEVRVHYGYHNRPEVVAAFEAIPHVTGTWERVKAAHAAYHEQRLAAMRAAVEAGESLEDVARRFGARIQRLATAQVNGGADGAASQQTEGSGTDDDGTDPDADAA